MRLIFHKLTVLAALGFLLAHNLIPHHHHGLSGIETEHRHHHEGDHDHDHVPFAFVHVDEVFLFKSLGLKLAHSAVAAVVPRIAVLEEISETKLSGFISVPIGHPPLPPFLTAFSFRGPPSL